jgi:transposase
MPAAYVKPYVTRGKTDAVAAMRFFKACRADDDPDIPELVIGMTSQVQRARGFPERVHPWIMQLLDRKPVRRATLAMPNKTARFIRAVLTNEKPYRQSAA